MDMETADGDHIVITESFWGGWRERGKGKEREGKGQREKGGGGAGQVMSGGGKLLGFFCGVGVCVVVCCGGVGGCEL